MFVDCIATTQPHTSTRHTARHARSAAPRRQISSTTQRRQIHCIDVRARVHATDRVVRVQDDDGTQTIFAAATKQSDIDDGDGARRNGRSERISTETGAGKRDRVRRGEIDQDTRGTGAK